MLKLRIFEYVGPYGVGKTTRCRADALSLKGQGHPIYSLDDFYAFVNATSRRVRAWWLIRNGWAYSLVAFGLVYSVTSGGLPERFVRARRTARKMVYTREFARGRSGYFLNDEGLLHSMCQALTGSNSVVSSWLLATMYRGLRVRFVYMQADEDTCVQRLVQRNKLETPGSGYADRTFLALINSKDPSELRYLVEHASCFYRDVINKVGRKWDVGGIGVTSDVAGAVRIGDSEAPSLTPSDTSSRGAGA